MASRLRRSVPVTVNDVLDGRVALDLECLDRPYLHGYLGQLQVGGQVIQFLNHLRPAGPVQYRRQVPDQCDHPRHRGHRRRLLQALAHQAIP